ncbi:hypothetical protein MHIMP23_15350 [Methylobacterium hispanicum]
MERIGARGSGGSLALGIPLRRAPGLALPALRGWIGRSLATEAAQRRLFPWLAVAFGAGILLFFGVADGAPVLAAPDVPRWSSGASAERGPASHEAPGAPADRPATRGPPRRP